MVYQKFKMTTVMTCIGLMTTNCYQAAVDLSDAYFSVKVHPKYRKYLRFIWKGVHYDFVGLPQGLSCSPRIFTKIMKPIIESLQKMGHTVCAYLDDLYIVNQTYQGCTQAIEATIRLLSDLGFHVNF